jgi:hypothetical protein
MKNILASFPGEQALLKMYPDVRTLQVNGHLHTPYSFSAFEDIPQIFEMARKENISVVGINDFFVADGYGPFYREALKSNIFPLFNIEFIGLMKAEQQHNIRVNDPNNPGRCYFSGKGLDYPFTVDGRLSKKLNRIVEESQVQVRAMIDKVNGWFRQVGAGIALDYYKIRESLAKELVRERHIAKAIRMAVYDKYRTDPERNGLLAAIFEGSPTKSGLTDIPALENEIRGNLLKSGGRAFVEEDDNAFMNIDEVIEIIANAGGIPCYPVLLDDKNGNYTGYEKDPEHLWKELTGMKIRCVELIPGRNDALHLERFVRFFRDKGFVILMGTEHNTPDMIPLTCDTRGRVPLTPEMQRISYEGACVVAAHQYLRARKQHGFGSPGRPAGNDAVESLFKLGNAVIHYYIQHFKSDQ